MGVDLEVDKAETGDSGSVFAVLEAVSAVADVVEAISVGEVVGGESDAVGEVEDAEGRAAAVGDSGLYGCACGDSD